MDDLIADSDFAWSIRMRRDQPEAFFAARDPSGGLLERRHHWLDTAPGLCLASTEAGDRIVGEVWDLAIGWGQVEPGPDRTFENLGRRWEVDVLLLDVDTFQLAGGCVCFPSSWSLQESTGRTLTETHSVVPGLNEQIGAQIERFLQRLRPGSAYLRANWSLTGSAHLNYHPALKRPRLDAGATLSEVHLRIEHQSFVRTPTGILMGLRIEPVALERLVALEPETARRLHRQLATMPPEVARYKGMATAVGPIAEHLGAALA